MTEPTPYTAPAAGPARPTNTLAIIAIIAAVVVAPVGIILGFIAKNQIKQTGENGAGLAKAAIIIGIVLTVLWLLIVILSVLLPFLIVGSVGGYNY
jgi:hypothetical protein